MHSRGGGETSEALETSEFLDSERIVGHGEDFTVAVFVANRADFFGGDVVFGGDVEGMGGEHGAYCGE